MRMGYVFVFSLVAVVLCQPLLFSEEDFESDNVHASAEMLQDPVEVGTGVGPAAAQIQGSEEESYLLRVGDRVRIKIYPEDDYIKGGEMEISSEGNVTIPLVGKVRVEGRSVIEAERAIAQILTQDYIVNPEVVIEVLEYKKLSVVVLGEVRKPGTYQFPSGQTKLSLLQAVSLAGGFSDIANIKKIRIVRDFDGKKEVLHANAEAIIKGNDPDIRLKAGDVINVSESLF
ncbi:MAG: polysaccharide export protein [Candidatus Omnitrophica bacterium]|nr:polysaccharide export protein [Candidatus Omnitrophota bacterium]